MHLLRTNVLEELEAKEITELFHANSVLTACQFLKKQSLLSRGTLERYNYKQTVQSSDAIDKQYSLWFDVFTDTVDIHHRGRMVNIYGPVLFVLDAKILTESTTGRVWVTKLNPTRFPKRTEAERWFQNKADLKANLIKGRFDQMVVFRHCGGQLQFEKYLKKIILDDPNHELTKGKVDMFSMAYGALSHAMSYSGINVPIEKRICTPNCGCQASYAADINKMLKMFTPSIYG